jgi:hypothetical protein
MAESNGITDTAQLMTCIHGVRSALHIHVFKRQLFSVVERVTVFTYQAPQLKKQLLAKNIIHNNIERR